MSQVVLVNAPISFEDKYELLGDETSNPPLGILYLAACLEKRGISVKVYDVRAQELSLKSVIKKIEEDAPLLVGISSLTPSIRASVELATSVKREFGKDGPLICLGGPHLSADPTFIERFPVFDLGVAGEGEITFTKIIEDIVSGKKVKGLFVGKTVENLDDLPFPARHMIDKNYYREPGDEKYTQEEQIRHRRAPLIGSRGCPFDCYFCSRPVHRDRYRFRSAKNVVDEMETTHSDYGGRYIFMDDTTTLNRKNTFDLCNEILKRGLDVHWMAMTRATCVDEEILALMAKAGCHDLFFGVESGNDRIRNKIIGKNVKDEDIFRAVKLCRRYGIQSNLFLMLGFPTEGRKEIEDTINFGRKSQADLIGIRITVPLPGSRLFADAVEEGTLSRGLINDYASGKMGKVFRGVWPLYIPKGLTLEYLVEAKKRTYRNFYLDPRWILRRILHDLKSLERLNNDLRMVRIGVYALLRGTTKTSMS